MADRPAELEDATSLRQTRVGERGRAGEGSTVGTGSVIAIGCSIATVVLILLGVAIFVLLRIS